MKLYKLKIGDRIRIKHKLSSRPEIYEVEGFGKQHCQLHGEFIGNTITLRKIKSNGRKGIMWSPLLDSDKDFDLLEYIKCINCNDTGKLIYKLSNHPFDLLENCLHCNAEGQNA